MNSARRSHIAYLILILTLCSFVSLAGAYAKAKETKGDTVSGGLIELQGCEGVRLTQCELAMELMTTLKMGEDLTCETGFIHLKALDIAPGEDWYYEDPHKVVTGEELKDVLDDVHRAYNNGTVRLDGFAVAENVNRLCMDLQGPRSNAPSGANHDEKKEEGIPLAPVP